MKKMTIWPFLISTLILSSCNSTDLVDEERSKYFQKKLTKSLLNKESINIQLSKLTSFKWDKVCFKRNGRIRLIFTLNGEDTYTLHLGLNKYLIEEGYFPRSPRDRCYSDDKYFEIKKRKIGERNVIQLLEKEPTK